MLQAGHHGIGNKSLRCGAFYSHSPDVGDHLVRHFGSAGCRASGCVCRLAVPAWLRALSLVSAGSAANASDCQWKNTDCAYYWALFLFCCELWAVLHRKLIADHGPHVSIVFSTMVFWNALGARWLMKQSFGLPCVSRWCDRHCRAHDALLGRVASVFMARVAVRLALDPLPIGDVVCKFREFSLGDTSKALDERLEFDGLRDAVRHGSHIWVC